VVRNANNPYSLQNTLPDPVTPWGKMPASADDLLGSKRAMPMRVDEKDVVLMSLTCLVSQNSQEDVVVQGSGLSRGDRQMPTWPGCGSGFRPVTRSWASICADEKQAIALDHDSQVLARVRLKAKA
jgi:hypothetical protein